MLPTQADKEEEQTWLAKAKVRAEKASNHHVTYWHLSATSKAAGKRCAKEEEWFLKLLPTGQFLTQRILEAGSARCLVCARLYKLSSDQEPIDFW